MTLAEFGLSAAAVTFAINFLTSLLKNYVFPRWGKTGVQGIVAFLALAGAGYWYFLADNPGVKAFVVAALGLFSLAVTFYEVIWSRIDWFEAAGPREQ